MKEALFLADGGPNIGLGHIRRCQRLAAAFADIGFHCRMLVPNPALAQCPGTDAWPADLRDLPQADVVVADSKRITQGHCEAWGAAGYLRVIVDDLNDRHLSADVVLNHNVYAASLDYSAWEARRLLLGIEWAIVDQSFAAAILRRSAVASRRILISFGGIAGSHAEDVARRLLRCSADIAVFMVIPPGAPEPALADARLTLLRAPDMAAAMAATDIYVGAAGITAMEAATAGMSLAVCALYPDQRLAVSQLSALKIAAFTEYDAAVLAQAAIDLTSCPTGNPLAGRIDGSGADRVAAEISSLVGKASEPKVGP